MILLKLIYLNDKGFLAFKYQILTLFIYLLVIDL